MTPRLVLATLNPHKVVELRAILADLHDGPAPGLDAAVVGLEAYDAPEVVESGVTFAANALLKARAAAALTGLPSVADDSGLAVDVLGGAPGVFSARWSGGHGGDRAAVDRANVELLLAQLADVPDDHRGARFVCALALVVPTADGSLDGAAEHVEHGELPGTLERSPRGAGGFGYDPVLRLLDRPQTLAEVEPQEKNRISHRSQAVRAMAPRLLAVLAQHPAEP